MHIEWLFQTIRSLIGASSVVTVGRLPARKTLEPLENQLSNPLDLWFDNCR